MRRKELRLEKEKGMTRGFEIITNFNKAWTAMYVEAAVDAGTPRDLAEQSMNLRPHKDGFALLSYGDGETIIAVATKDEWWQLFNWELQKKTYPNLDCFIAKRSEWFNQPMDQIFIAFQFGQIEKVEAWLRIKTGFRLIESMQVVRNYDGTLTPSGFYSDKSGKPPAREDYPLIADRLVWEWRPRTSADLKTLKHRQFIVAHAS